MVCGLNPLSRPVPKLTRDVTHEPFVDIKLFLSNKKSLGSSFFLQSRIQLSLSSPPSITFSSLLPHPLPISSLPTSPHPIATAHLRDNVSGRHYCPLAIIEGSSFKCTKRVLMQSFHEVMLVLIAFGKKKKGFEWGKKGFNVDGFKPKKGSVNLYK